MYKGSNNLDLIELSPEASFEAVSAQTRRYNIGLDRRCTRCENSENTLASCILIVD